MTKRTLYLLLALVVVSSVALATLQGTDLQGAFKLTGQSTFSTAILHVSSNASADSNLTWNESDINTLGVWKLKADQNMSINGFAFNIGVPLTAGTSDANAVGKVFSDCKAVLTESGNAISTLIVSTCSYSYPNLNLESGKTYTLTLTASPLSSALDYYYSQGLDQKQVALSFLGVTKADGTVTHYYDSTMATSVDQQASTSVTDSHDDAGVVTYTLEYTYGGYTLQNTVFTQADESPSISESSQGVQVQQNAATTTTGTNNTISPSTGSVQNLLNTISVKIGSTSAITKPLTIKVSAGGATMEITNGMSTKTCTSTSSGTYSCDIP